MYGFLVGNQSASSLEFAPKSHIFLCAKPGSLLPTPPFAVSVRLEMQSPSCHQMTDQNKLRSIGLVRDSCFSIENLEIWWIAPIVFSTRERKSVGPYLGTVCSTSAIMSGVIPLSGIIGISARITAKFGASCISTSMNLFINNRHTERVTTKYDQRISRNVYSRSSAG